MALNLNVYRGVTPQLLKDTVRDWRQYVKTDDEVDGVRVTLEEHQKFIAPVLLSSSVSLSVESVSEDERKSESIQ